MTRPGITIWFLIIITAYAVGAWFLALAVIVGGAIGWALSALRRESDGCWMCGKSRPTTLAGLCWGCSERRAAR